MDEFLEKKLLDTPIGSEWLERFVALADCELNGYYVTLVESEGKLAIINGRYKIITEFQNNEKFKEKLKNALKDGVAICSRNNGIEYYLNERWVASAASYDYFFWSKNFF